MVADITQDKAPCSCEHNTTLFWCGPGKNIPVLHFRPDVCLYKNTECSCNKLASRGVGLTYKLVKTECRLLRQLLEGHGFREVHQNSNDFNVMWCGCHVKPYTLRGLTELQKVNHFPRSYEITRKDRLYKNFMRMRQTMGAKHYDFLPVTFVLPSEVNDFYSTFQREKGYWIAKPVASSRGRGISIISHPNQVNLEEQTVVCKYISNPLLVDGFKFDLRIYVMVTSFDPLRVYIFNEGLARFSTVRYDGSQLSLDNMFMHLTNYSINKKNQGYVKCSDPDIEDYGNKWSMSALLRYLKNEGYDTTTMMMKVEDMIIKTILSAEVAIANACRMFLPHRENCFELFGFDVIFDEDSKPWLLEVNLSPSLACESPLDLKIKSNLVSHMLTLAGVVALDPYSKRDSGTRRKSSAKGPYSLSIDGTNAAPLSNEDLRLVRQTKEEFVRKGAFSRIFPTEDSWDLYGQFLENKTHYNFMLHSQLYPNRFPFTHRAKDRSRPSSAVVSMNKFREITSTNNKLMNYCTIYSGIRERYSRYEKSLQPLGTVEDYPPEALVDAITPDFSIPDDLTSETTRDADTVDETSSVYSCEFDGVRRTIATQTLLPDLESKACSADSIVDTPDIPTDARPLADILNGIRRGCLRPLSFPECYHPIYSPPYSSSSYDRHTSVFTPTYSAFNPSTQAFELPLSRKERVEQYSIYVDRINKSSSRVNLVEVKCPPNKSVLRLLPNRPRSGDKVKKDEERMKRIAEGDKRRTDINTDLDKERERPGSLTLRNFPPDRPPTDRPTSRLQPGPSQEKPPVTTVDVNKTSRPLYRIPGYRGTTEARLLRSQSGIATRSSNSVMSRASSIHRNKSFTFASSKAPPSESGSRQGNAGYQGSSRQENTRQGNSRGGSRELQNTTKLGATYYKSLLQTAPPKKKKKEKPAIGVEIIKQSQLDFGYAKVKGEIKSYEKFLEEQKIKKQEKTSVYSRPSSSMTLKSEFRGVPGNVSSANNSRANSSKPRTAPATTATAKTKEKAKEKLSKKRGNKTTSEVSLTISVGKAPATKENTHRKETSDKPQLPLKPAKSPPAGVLPAKEEPTRSRPTSASSRRSTKSNKSETGVNVSVFTRDNITISPKDVTVSRTINRTQTTILVTVPHSGPVFTKTNVGKVEISLDRSKQPAPQHVEVIPAPASPTTPYPASTCCTSNASIPQLCHTPASTLLVQSSTSLGAVCDVPSDVEQPDTDKTTDTSPERERRGPGNTAALITRNNTVDSGYSSTCSPVVIKPAYQPKQRAKNRPPPQEDPTTIHPLDDIPQLPDQDTSASLTKAPKTARKKKTNQPESAKATKPSPYGSVILIQRHTKSSRAARPAKPVPESVEQASPYGAAYTRYRSNMQQSEPGDTDGRRGSENDGLEERRFRTRKDSDDKKNLSELRKRISMYSSAVHLQAAVKARKKELSCNSLPSIYKEGQVVERRLAHFSSDMVLHRTRMLLGTM